MKRILVTGASGFLGSNLIASLLEKGDTEVIAILGRPEDKANSLPRGKNITILPCSELFTTDFGHIDTLIHTAFSRGDNLPGLTRSIEFTEHIIELVNEQDIESIINISSQGVYKSQLPGERVDENGFVEPNTTYGLAKWAVENMLTIGCKKRVTNIRMASLSANARFLCFFVDSVINGNDITVSAPNQYASILDISDAVSGIIAIESISIEQRSTVYNLGPGIQYSILNYANSVNVLGQELGYHPVTIQVQDNGNTFAICMDCSRVISQTSWNAIIQKEEMLKTMFKERIIQI